MRQPQGIVRCSSVGSLLLEGACSASCVPRSALSTLTGRIPDRDRTCGGVAVPVVSGARGRRGDPLIPVPPGHTKKPIRRRGGDPLGGYAFSGPGRPIDVVHSLNVIVGAFLFSASDPINYIITQNGSHPPDPTRVRRDAVQSGLPCAEREETREQRSSPRVTSDRIALQANL